MIMLTESLMVMLSARRTDHFPAGAVTEKGARALFVVLVLISFLLVLTLNTMTILLSIAALALAWGIPVYEAVYPSPASGAGARRLAGRFNGFAAVSESVPLSCWLMFLANILGGDTTRGMRWLTAMMM